MFNYADLKINDLVEVVVDIARDPHTGAILMNEVHPGTVLAVYHDGADITITSPSIGQRVLEWCVHIDDDRCQVIGPIEERFKESRDDVNGTPGTGVFRLSRNQKILLGLEPRLAAQERLLNELVFRVTQLEEKDAPANKPKSGRKQVHSAEPAMAR